MRCDVIKVEQGSDQWHALRAGRITASRLGDVIAKPTTKRYQGYMAELLKELTGADPLTVSDTPRWMEHGKQWEPFGLKAYEWQQGEAIVHDVFCVSRDYDWLACSPDGLVARDEGYTKGLELKCRSKMDTYLTAVCYAKTTGHPEPAYKPQLQGSMLVTGLEQWDYANYLRMGEASKLSVVPCMADEQYQSMLLERALEFRTELMKRFHGHW